MRKNVLEYVFVASEVLLQQAKVLFALIDEVGNNFEHTWLAYIFTVQVDEVATVADLPIKLRWNTLSPEHVDHFVLVFVRQLSAHGEWVQILNEQHVNVHYKVFVVKVVSINASIRNIGQEVSRFDSGSRIFYSGSSISNLVAIHHLIFFVISREIWAFFCRHTCRILLEVCICHCLSILLAVA